MSMRRTMEYASSFGLLIILRANDPWLSENGCMHEGEVSTRLGLAGISDAAELASCITTNQLNRYSVSRHLVGANTIAASERARRLITSENFLTRRTIITACYSFNLFRFMQRSLARVILDG